MLPANRGRFLASIDLRIGLAIVFEAHSFGVMLDATVGLLAIPRWLELGADIFLWNSVLAVAVQELSIFVLEDTLKAPLI